MPGFVKQNLAQLFQKIPVKVLSLKEIPAVSITGVQQNSRKVSPGNLFVAQVGDMVDGHKYIPEAIKKGAAAIVGSEALEGKFQVPYIQVSDSRAASAYLSAAFFGFPARQMTVIGVTGTDGKTTTSNLIYNILLQAGYPTGIISTVNAVIGDEVLDTGFHVTTPDAPEIQRLLSRMVTAGLRYVVLETTSHGLAQDRVTGCEFDVAVVTNITHEHLDYHGTYEAYRAAKGRLLDFLAETAPKKHGNPRVAVINRDDISYEYLRQKPVKNLVSYGQTPNQATIWCENTCFDARGLHFDLVSDAFRLPMVSPLVGDYNVSNIMAAAAAAIYGLGIDPPVAARGVAAVHGIPGRMERINLGQSFAALVDFAHTPNALRKALETARKLTEGRVIAVFGSAGLRDREKRHLMAEESARLADISIFTAEDPRTESLDGILAEMAAAAAKEGREEGKSFYRVPDRGDAIRFALQLAKDGDVVIACGKGHEQSMCFGTTEYAWDDRIAMRAALAEFLNKPGPEMPSLPTSRKSV
ncbi:MAG: UDP-N-acetylmuramoyl-L-alanyl-D-glutamate--2,6-diaminopimelate ligase [Chloroflexi bacterium]|nr:UDP-N-acetylmuramoyl-L-alanyl-D-glutamate--2,6-diaminopimelate ligase [Chloroflexota bacterium]